MICIRIPAFAFRNLVRTTVMNDLAVSFRATLQRVDRAVRPDMPAYIAFPR